MRVNLKKQLRFPEEITLTSLRPDIVLWSRDTKQVILIELTVPWEERVDEAHEYKRAKYQERVLECQEKGWKAWNLLVEVGCRGFAAKSHLQALGQLGSEGGVTVDLAEPQQALAEDIRRQPAEGTGLLSGR